MVVRRGSTVSANRWWNSIFSLLLIVRKKRCARAALLRGVVFLKPIRHLKLRLRLIFFFKCHIQSGVNKRQLFLKKNLIFNFLVSWRKAGFMAVYLSTLKQIFVLKLACCKIYLPIYSFVRRGISSTAITKKINVFLDNKQERDHLCAFDLGANYCKIEKGYGDLLLHVFI